MLRWLVRAVALALLAAAVVVPSLLAGLGAPARVAEETTIRSYEADFTVDTSGDLAVVETLAVYFPFDGKHGIFRYFDTADTTDSRLRHLPRDLSVTRDGAPERIDWSREKGGRYRVARIGSPDVTLVPGVHVYVLRYRIDGVLVPGQGAAQTDLYWNLIPGGWQQPIELARLTVRLPAPAEEVDCAVGFGATRGCEARGRGTELLRVTVSDLRPYTPVTLRAGMDLPTPPPADRLPWPASLSSVFGSSLPGAVAVAALALLGGGAGWLLSRGTREPTPPYPLQYAPPPGLGPAQAAYVLRERVGKTELVASLMYAAERGAVGLDRQGKDWSVTDRQGPAGWAAVDEVTGTLAGLLSGPGTTFVARRKDTASGEELKDALERLTNRSKTWARGNDLVVPAGLGSLGGLVVIGAAALAVLAIFTLSDRMAMVALVPGLFAIGAIELILPGASTRRTGAGRELWSRLGGFRRVLSTPSSAQRFEFSGREELYTAYLPWAVAFGCAAAWADKYRAEMGTEPPVPAYLGGYPGAHTGNYVDQMVGDFSSTVSSAISSYESSQSSSGGGGGFSGGGGGGGGGGGSW